MEVEVREEATVEGRAPSRETTALLGNNTPYYPVTESPVVIVRVEEVLLVVLVLIIWAGAIALFFNRWGKIRMLEPYQPKFRGGASSGSVAPSVGGPCVGASTAHRPSCPLAPLSPPGGLGQVGACPRICPLRPKRIDRQQALERDSVEAMEHAQPIARMSFSKYNVNALTDPLSALPSPIIRRPRQNSVFVGSPGALAALTMGAPPPRRVKSAVDIHHLLIASDRISPTGHRKGSIIPIFPSRDRRPSLITIERPAASRHRRPSTAVDRPFCPPSHRPRRSSCFVSSPGPSAQHTRQHRNFLSFELERRAKQQALAEKPSCSYHPTISFETPLESMEASAETMDIMTVVEDAAEDPLVTFSGAKPKISRSFEHTPLRDKPRPERLANSLDVSFSFDRRSSIPEEDKDEEKDRSSPIYINMEDTKITAPLLEGLKSSDV